MTRRNQPEAAAPTQRDPAPRMARARQASPRFTALMAAGDPVERAILKAIGTVAGIPDIIRIFQGRVYALGLKAGAAASPTFSAWCTSGFAKLVQTSP